MREFAGECAVRPRTNYVLQREEGRERDARPLYEGDFNRAAWSREIIYLSGESSITDLRESRTAARSRAR